MSIQFIVRKKSHRGAARLWTIFFVLSLFWVPLSAADQKPSEAPSGPMMPHSDSPLHITSDRMDVDQTERTILFQGHVMVQQDNLTITGRSIRVFVASDATVSNREESGSMMDQIDRIEVEGDVVISQEDKTAMADRAVYYHKEQKIVLMGNPRAIQGPNTIEGQLITLFLQEGRSVVEGGSQAPVKAVLHPN